MHRRTPSRRTPSRRTPGIALGLGLLAALAATPLHAQHETVGEFRWRGDVHAGQWIEIKGVNGHIRAEPTEGSEVEVVATYRDRRDRDDVLIQSVRHADGVTVCALYRGGQRGAGATVCSPGDEWQASNGGFRTKVDFVVKVPRGVHFLGATINGDVTGHGLPADAVASTVNGEVRISAAGTVEASTVNGDVEATIGRADPDRDLEFRSVNGSFTLDVPADFSARVQLVSNGPVTSDFPLAAEGRRPRYGPSRQRLGGTVGDGRHELHVQSLNGSITLRRAATASGGR
jgi:hypothetical protein